MFSEVYSEAFEFAKDLLGNGKSDDHQLYLSFLSPRGFKAVESLAHFWEPLELTEMRNAARSIKFGIFKNKIQLVVPLYVSSICIEDCPYCNFRSSSPQAPRVRLTPDQLETELRFLIKEKGYRSIELVYSTDPGVKVSDICRQIEHTKNYLTQSGGGLVGLNAQPHSTSDYESFLSAGLDFSVLWQETYDERRYSQLHSGHGSKPQFWFRLDAYERMYESGVRNIGMGVLSGISYNWRLDWILLLLHEEYLAQRFGQPISILGIPRLKTRDKTVAELFANCDSPSDDEYVHAVAVHNLYSPTTMPFVNTREAWDTNMMVAAGGGCLFTLDCATIPGGYSLGQEGEQFPTFAFNIDTYSQKAQEAGFMPEKAWTF